MKYAYSNDGVMYHGQFDTKEEAVLEGFFSYEEEIIYVGEVVPYTAHHFVDADNLLQDMQVRACDEVGEWADDWMVNMNLETNKRLEAELKAAIGDIVEKYDPPSFYAIKNVEEWLCADAISSGLYDPNA